MPTRNKNSFVLQTTSLIIFGEKNQESNKQILVTNVKAHILNCQIKGVESQY
jgi:hypothetical protein